MEQEETVVHVDQADGGARLAVGRHVGQLVVAAEGLAAGCGTDAAGDIEFLLDDVVPDAVYGVQIGGVAGECGHVGHAGIHIGGAHGMAHGLVLLGHGLVGLGVVVAYGGAPAVVEEELGLVQILPLAGDEVELGQRHLGYLVSGHHAGLSRAGPHLAADAVGIAYGHVEKAS